MRIWAIGDLHLSFGIQNKSMDVFGPAWESHADQIEKNWKSLIKPDDLVLIPGDISWAMKLEDAKADLDWIHSLPGTKVMIKGNHDFWWGSLGKTRKALPPSIHIIQNDSFLFEDIAIAGARLWDTNEYSFHPFINFQKPLKEKEEVIQQELQEKIFERELERLKLSLKSIPKNANRRIAMTHYPPIGSDLSPSNVSKILEEHKIDTCVFGHLHSVKNDSLPFGEKNGVRYILTSSDYIHFKPICVSS